MYELNIVLDESGRIADAYCTMQRSVPIKQILSQIQNDSTCTLELKPMIPAFNLRQKIEADYEEIERVCREIHLNTINKGLKKHIK